MAFFGQKFEKRTMFWYMVLVGPALYGFNWAIFKWVDTPLAGFITPSFIVMIIGWIMAYRMKNVHN